MWPTGSTRGRFSDNPSRCGSFTFMVRCVGLRLKGPRIHVLGLIGEDRWEGSMIRTCQTGAVGDHHTFRGCRDESPSIDLEPSFRMQAT